MMPTPEFIAEHNEQVLNKFKDDNLRRVVWSPLFNQGKNPLWFVAGTENSWAEIRTCNGLYTVQAYQRNDKGVVVKKPAANFQCAKHFQDMTWKGVYAETEFSWSLYALHLAFQTAKQACEEQDWPRARQMIDTLKPHVPWLTDALALSSRLHPSDAHTAFEHFTQAMESTGIWDAVCPDDTLRHGLLEPWLRVALFLKIIASASPEYEPSLWTLKNPKDNGPCLHAWVNPRPVGLYTTCVLMDENMRPLFLANAYPTWATYNAVPEPNMYWAIDKGPKNIKTFKDWQQSMARCPGDIAKWCNTFKNATPQELDPKQAANATTQWAHHCNNSRVWQKKGHIKDIMAWSTWAVKNWKQNQPILGLAFDDLTFEHVENAVEKIDEWQKTIVGLHALQNKPQPPQVLPLPEYLQEDAP